MSEPTSESYLNEEELEHFRQKLLAMRDEIYAESAATVEEMQNESTLYPDPSDRASLEAEHFNTLRIRDRERKLLGKIEAALQRIEDGTFGICEVTGDPIERKRLEARPVTTLSLKAKQEQEQEELRQKR